MALPSFNLTAKNVPADKQMSMMRTYLSQLKDETETELYDIKWDNLSQSLRKRIEDLDAYVNQVNDYSQMTAQSIKANVIDADLVTASEVSAKIANFDFASIGILTSEVLLTRYINADFISGLEISVQAANIKGQLTASQIKADIVTSGQIDTLVANAGFIKAGYITAELIRGKIFGSESANIDWINATNIKLTSGVVMDIRLDSGVRSFTFQPVTMNGYYVLAAAQPH